MQPRSVRVRAFHLPTFFRAERPLTFSELVEICCVRTRGAQALVSYAVLFTCCVDISKAE
jgi:hypothetical protein